MLTPAMLYSLWACVGSYWVAGARSLLLFGLRKYPVFTLFVVLANAARGLWFMLDPRAYRDAWQATEYVALALQIGVTIEAYWVLAIQVRNFSWRWRVLGVLALPGVVVAAILALDESAVNRWAHFLNQVAGFGLGVVALVGFGLSAAIPLRMSRNSLIHGAVICVMWLSSALGFRLYHEHWTGWWILTCGPALACLAWALLMTRGGEVRPPEDPSDAEQERIADEDIIRGRAAGLID